MRTTGKTVAEICSPGQAVVCERWQFDPRLHDARHTAATVLLILGVPERVVMQIMGWSSTAMAARYQHVTGGILADVAQRVGGLIRQVAKEADGRAETPSQGAR